mmetsp:Transcript_31910/g.105857  ORF Transcript_31910/g.105857 Transcript_31910/m.105857 type:complete len:568 (+) Transcript_31910:71-1774(+)|eukprot:CAMPEP_0203927014 /NCGR_PEP_ID=MMETSP0359-20131031/66484_1 /ASSEMBLY_ACC=CAM_ASM_000338 /TAXON_ID=268821 /ORGANISM="Scrippsiella Hangoei, Strain SHTV-5" /LENGTH=567 /DNA_ID=CAMNT_0050855709 /DNA_START=51 /DNA_END=1754 /DNA_ORIENTATION=-
MAVAGLVAAGSAPAAPCGRATTEALLGTGAGAVAEGFALGASASASAVSSAREVPAASLATGLSVPLSAAILAGVGAHASQQVRRRKMRLMGGIGRGRLLRMAASSSPDEVSEAEDEVEDKTWSLQSPRVQTLILLLLIFVGNQACRAVPFYLVDFSPAATPELAINSALDFSSAEYGLLATFGFTVPFTLASLVAGSFADKAENRLQLSGLAGLGWSAVVASMALAGSYPMLLGQRGLMGIFQAATNPASLPLIAELFPEARATASAVFGLGIYLGGGFASLGAYLDQSLGWRGTFLVFAAASAAASALALVPGIGGPTKEKAAGVGPAATTAVNGSASEQASLLSLPAQVAEAAKEVFANAAEATSSVPARWIYLASTFRFCAGFAILVWLPAAIRTQFPGDIESFAIYNSLIKAVAGSLSSLAGGIAADMLRARGLGDKAGALFCAASAVLAAPLWYFTLDSSLSFEGSMGFLLAEYLVAEAWLGPAIASLQGAVPAERRGSAQGVFSALTGLGNVLPAALGLLAPTDLREGLQISVAICYGLSAACFVGAAASFPQDKPQTEL